MGLTGGTKVLDSGRINSLTILADGDDDVLTLLAMVDVAQHILHDFIDDQRKNEQRFTRQCRQREFKPVPNLYLEGRVRDEIFFYQHKKKATGKRSFFSN